MLFVVPLMSLYSNLEVSGTAAFDSPTLENVSELYHEACQVQGDITKLRVVCLARILTLGTESFCGVPDSPDWSRSTVRNVEFSTYDAAEAELGS